MIVYDPDGTNTVDTNHQIVGVGAVWDVFWGRLVAVL